VRKIIDDQGENDRVRLSVPAIYDTIKRSNSSLNRKPKRILEDSIERVVEVVKSDVLGEDEEDSVNGDFEGLEEQAQPVPVRDM
jgi:ribosome biogenesis ATPase